MILFIKIILAVMSLFSQVTTAQELSTTDLLKLVEQGQARDKDVTEQRINYFMQRQSQQNDLLLQANIEKQKLEILSASKESEFRSNEQKINTHQQQLEERLGGLKEMFGVLQQVAGDAKSVFAGSVISSQVESREQFLSDLIQSAGSSSKLPSVGDLERLWFELLQEITLSGQIATYEAEVVQPSGDTKSMDVIRLGGFNAVANGRYLDWDLDRKRLVEISKQPGSRYTDSLNVLNNTEQEALSPVWVDPTRGQLLNIIGQSPELSDRVKQGGAIGYFILALGGLGVLIALWRMLILAIEQQRINAQMKASNPNDNNSLGRLMSVFKANEDCDGETLELHLGEAISAEVPRLTKMIGWVKIISVIAPLLGLLGTVTGMIDVFETMSLFGTGDPKLMAGGISQALVTTVLGLVAAIPCVFLHTMANNRSRTLIMILEERAMGILARQSEKHASDTSPAAS